MALQIADRIKERTTTTGTGALALGGAATGYRAFSAVCSVNDTCYYAIEAVDGNGVPTGAWECGLGTYSAANTLTRTTPNASSNSGNAVDFQGGTKNVWLDFTAMQIGTYATTTSLTAYLASPPAIGGTAAAAGSFTTLSASSTVSGAGFSTYLASPPAIGGSAAAAGSFTTLSASSTVSGTGFSTYLAAPPAIGGTTPAAGTFTNLTYTGVLSAAAGLVGTPSLYLGGDTTSGWYRRSAQVWTYSNQGTGVFEFNTTQFSVASTANLGFLSGGISTAADTTILRAAANSLRYGGSTATTTSRTELNKAVASIANAVATSVLTITIPNAAHSASLLVSVTSSLGAGGAIGANEASCVNEYLVAVTRTAGVNATAAISTVFGAAATAVAGAATVTGTATLAAVVGAVGATNTIDVQVTISRSTGSSTNHTCLVFARLMNANASGITIA